MTKSKGPSFVDRVREDASRYLQELLTENERLRNTVNDMQTEQRRLCEEKDALQRAIEFERNERTAMHERIETIERENESYLAQFVTVQEQISDLANLYVAAYRVSGTLERAKVVSAIEEIIINILGSEELAIFEIAEDGRELVLASSFGIEAREFQRIDLGSGVIGRVAQSGDAYLPIGSDEPRETCAGLEINACVPLVVDGRVTGAIAVFRLLQQKERLTESDGELLNLLGTHAATALYASR